MALPYQIAVLCYLFDAEGRLLLLHRRKPPNFDLYSPIGGKLEQATGESPTQCAIREIREEVGLVIEPESMHLTGIVSEAGYRGESHWLTLLYEGTPPVSVAPAEFREGRLEWHPRPALDHLPIPDTDRRVIWPLFWQHRGGFFMVHIDCTQPEDQMAWRVEQLHTAATPLPPKAS